MEIDDIKAKITASDLNNLSKPSHFIKLDTLPLLGSGKPDFKSAKKIALDDLA